jgi:excisionase family DNA binding protein
MADGKAAAPTVTCTLPSVTSRTGISRSEIYRLLSAGKLRAIKSGRTTLIVWTSVVEHLNGLPAATFRAPKASPQ